MKTKSSAASVKRKRPTSDAQSEVATGCRELLSGVEALTKPDYHRMNMSASRNDRLLHAVLCAYAKHHLDCDDIGWNQLGDILHSAICNEIASSSERRDSKPIAAVSGPARSVPSASITSPALVT